jgi:hypothetical protein
MYHHPNFPFFCVLEKERKLGTQMRSKKVNMKQKVGNRVLQLKQQHVLN